MCSLVRAEAGLASQGCLYLAEIYCHSLIYTFNVTRFKPRASILFLIYCVQMRHNTGENCSVLLAS